MKYEYQEKSDDEGVKRLIEPDKCIDFKIYLLDNPHDIDNSIYYRFILMGTKT